MASATANNLPDYGNVPGSCAGAVLAGGRPGARRADPSVTIVVPAYNAAPFLGRTLASAVAQSHGNLEIIVVDDGSTDSTSQIAADFTRAHANLRVVTTPNRGVASARNTGTEQAGGEWIAYLDADDLWHPEKIARQIAALQQYPADSSWAGCYALYRTIDEADRVLRNGPRTGPQGAFLDCHLVSNPVNNGSSLMVRRDVALALGGFDPSFAQAGLGGVEDLDFQLKLLRDHRICLAPHYLVGYRRYPGAMSCNTRAMALGLVEAIDRHAGQDGIDARLAARARITARFDAAVRFAQDRHPGEALRTLAAAMRVSPADALPVFAGRLRKLGAGAAARLLGAARPGSGRAGQSGMLFAECAPEDGLA